MPPPRLSKEASAKLAEAVRMKLGYLTPHVTADWVLEAIAEAYAMGRHDEACAALVMD
jgi:hypothetical protein